MAYLILETNFFTKPEVKKLMKDWGLKGLGVTVCLLHHLQQQEGGKDSMQSLEYEGRRIGTSSDFVRRLLKDSGLFECGDEGCVTSHLIARRVRRIDYGVDESAKGETHKVETLQEADSQTKSSSHQYHINLERERERERERELENSEIEKEKDYDVDNARKALIDFGPDADDVDSLKFCIDKIFSQSMWLQSLATEGRFPIAYELKDGDGVGGGRYAWRDDLTELTKEWFRMRMMALKDFRMKSGDDMKQYFFHLMRPGSRTREEYVEWMKKKMKN